MTNASRPRTPPTANDARLPPTPAQRAGIVAVRPAGEAAGFSAVSVVLPVMNETTSLAETVRLLVDGLGSDLGELIVVLSPRTAPASRAVVDRLATSADLPLVVHTQTLPYLGGALREAFDLARCSHVVMMASDLETDPATVPEMVAVARENPAAIVTATRWSGPGRGRFQGYDPIKLVLNAGFQLGFRLLYRSRLSDMTYGFRLFPRAVLDQVRFEELRHPFLLETLVKPLRLGVEVIEVPTSWKARTEGRSNNPFSQNFAYVRVGLAVRFSKTSSFRRPPTEVPAR